MTSLNSSYDSIGSHDQENDYIAYSFSNDLGVNFLSFDNCTMRQIEKKCIKKNNLRTASLHFGNIIY